MSEAIVMVPREEPWSDERMKLIRDMCARDASEGEFLAFVAVCQRTQLDPLSKQIYLVKRWDAELGRNVASPQVGIDGFRTIAERSGSYRGQTPPQWCGPDGVWRDVWLEAKPPSAARVGVHRRGFREPVYRVARYESYCQRKKDGSLTRMWRTMPDVLLAKCAEALALRTAFPSWLSGLYTSEEMAQADNPELPAESTQPRAKVLPMRPANSSAATSPQPAPDAPSGAVLELFLPKLQARKTESELIAWLAELQAFGVPQAVQRQLWGAFCKHASALGFDGRKLAAKVPTPKRTKHDEDGVVIAEHEHEEKDHG